MLEDMERTKPFLKWAGGKFKLVDLITSFMPEHPVRYIEPFVGAGAVALNVPFGTVIVNDANEELVNVWTMLRNDPEAVIYECKNLFSGVFNTSDFYYQLRKEFNSKQGTDARRAALFIYLNKHGFNGLCRFNRRGEFNVPFGRYKSVSFDPEALRAVSKRMQGWLVTNQDYTFVMSMAKEGDVVYLDPPYAPLSDTSCFTSYSSSEFGLTEQQRLVQCIEEAVKRGAVVIVSNHDIPLVRELYKTATEIHEVSVQRNISCKGTKREKAKELIAVYRP